MLHNDLQLIGAMACQVSCWNGLDFPRIQTSIQTTEYIYKVRWEPPVQMCSKLIHVPTFYVLQKLTLLVCDFKGYAAVDDEAILILWDIHEGFEVWHAVKGIIICHHGHSCFSGI